MLEQLSGWWCAFLQLLCTRNTDLGLASYTTAGLFHGQSQRRVRRDTSRRQVSESLEATTSRGTDARSAEVKSGPAGESPLGRARAGVRFGY